MSDNQNGKGDSPRNIFSRDFRENYDLIDWKKSDKKEERNEKEEKRLE